MLSFPDANWFYSVVVSHLFVPFENVIGTCACCDGNVWCRFTVGRMRRWNHDGDWELFETQWKNSANKMSQKGFLFDSGDAIGIHPLSRRLRWMKENFSVFSWTRSSGAKKFCRTGTGRRSSEQVELRISQVTIEKVSEDTRMKISELEKATAVFSFRKQHKGWGLRRTVPMELKSRTSKEVTACDGKGVNHCNKIITNVSEAVTHVVWYRPAEQIWFKQPEIIDEVEGHTRWRSLMKRRSESWFE